ncbi:shikimate dehydrogenase [Candidatus Schneideria nysicola]|uniref:shikimate dehydrogenase n=1 Tax=Candidatus Schneideria nysicola TaxID=1081631 RepID=UPI001CAA7670|nr:shikimate dehydrogenase [Candidatus Schneideria nysicola]UAJ65232.1 shikimate dehydrogenase [Candidatus Schneideria nysicola]
MDDFAVFGNPIEHSKSPVIHAFFAKELKISHSYCRILAPLNNFEDTIKNFFNQGGLGANITVPFKERAFDICHQFTDSALLTRVVNTIKKQKDGYLLGENTDGIGLINDLQRLDFLHKNSKILLIGAGGAAKGVLPLLANFSKSIIVTNRTLIHADKLIQFYQERGISNIYTVSLNEVHLVNNIDLIINATSCGIYGKIPTLPDYLINKSVRCYDMFYNTISDVYSDTPFLSWCRQRGAIYCADGLGMLVAQAAYAFLLWHGILPPIDKLLNQLRPKK